MYEQRPLKRRIFSLPSLLLFVIFAAFVYFLLTQFPTDWSATFDTIAHMNPWYYLLAFALYYATFILRGQRWRMLAQNTGDLDDIPHGRLPTMRESSTYILIGWFVNSITWLRMGDGYRAWLFARGSGGSFSWSLGTVLAERVLDVVSMLLILLASAIFLLFSARSISDAAVFVIPGTSFVIPSHIFVILAIFLVVVLSLCVLVAMKLWGPRFAGKLPSRLEDEFHRFQSGTLGSMKQMPTVIALGGGAWGAGSGAAVLRGAGAGAGSAARSHSDSGVERGDIEHRAHPRRRGLRRIGHHRRAAACAGTTGSRVRRPSR